METDCGNCGKMPTLMNKFKSLLNQYTPKQHWGNSLWAFIHTITVIQYTRPELNNLYHQNIIPNLQGILKVIPCDACKEMYQKHLDLLLTLDFNKPLVLFRWSVDLHNQVNKKLLKKEITYEYAKNLWCN